MAAGMKKLPLPEPQRDANLKRDPNRELTWEEKTVNVLDICRVQLSKNDPKGFFSIPTSFFDLEKECATSCSNGKAEDVDMCAVGVVDTIDVSKELSLSELNFEKKWKSELTWDEKVVKVLHIVRCQEFTEFDPKTCDFVPTRFYRLNVAFFDFEKESMVGLGPPLSKLDPSRWFSLEASVNVISLKIVESDVGYPIHVFGTVLARDEVDYKCVYLFRRDRDNPQVITSPNDMLTLTGPYRGLAVTDYMYFEINLKIKCDDTWDRDFSKGVIEHNAISYTKHTIARLVTSWLSTIEFVYAPVQCAVEATLAVTVLRGPCNFNGKVIAWTARNRKNKIILYDSEAASTITEIGDDGSVQLSRRVVSVSLGENLVLCIRVCGGDGFKLKLGQHDDKRLCNVGSYELQVKVTWTSNLVARRQKVFKNFGRTMLLW